MPSLDLSDNTLLETTERGLVLVDPRDVRRSKDADFIYRRQELDHTTRILAALYVLRAGRVREDGTTVPIVRMALESPDATYGRRVLEGVAWYEDGLSEDWTVQADPRSMRLHWTRHPKNTSDTLLYRFLLPGRTDRLQAFHSGAGIQLHNRAVPGQEAVDGELRSDAETELIYYSLKPKNSLRIELPQGQTLRVASQRDTKAALSGEPGWMAVPHPEDASDFLWEVQWEARPASVNRISLCLGTVPVSRSYFGPGLLRPTDANLDFGPFYAQACLGTALCVRPHPPYLDLRTAAFRGPGEDGPPRLREHVLGAEFQYLATPGVTRQLLQGILAKYLPEMPEPEQDGHVAAQYEEDLPLLLIAATRLATLEGPSSIVHDRLPLLRRVGERILALRRPGEALPVVSERYGTPKPVAVKEPYFTALSCAGLTRLTQLEKLNEEPARAASWESPAYAMRLAAMSPWIDGGLWNEKTDAFIDCMDFSRGEASDDGESILPEGEARKEFAYYQVMTALWLGLLETPEQARKAFSWLDYTFTYATGRGGPSFPPSMDRTFFVLLDAYLRHLYGVRGAEPLLQRILDRGLDGGLPFTRQPFGTFGRTGSLHGEAATAATFTGSWFDNAPYFGLVLRLHYGLDYSHRGWALNDPKPLPGYPLTRVTGLRHGGATYAVSWQGSGTIRRVLLNGAPAATTILESTEGDHEVNVILGT